MREDGSKEGNVEFTEGIPMSVGFERALKIAVDFFDSPGQRAVLSDSVLAKLRDRFIVRTRKARKRELSVSVPIDVEKMVGRFLWKTGGPPRIRIDRALDHHRAIRLEHRPQL